MSKYLTTAGIEPKAEMYHAKFIGVVYPTFSEIIRHILFGW